MGQFVGNQNGYVEFSVRNVSNGVSASGDIAVYADNGTPTTNYIDMGINNSSASAYAYAGTVLGKALDAYLFNVGGNLIIGNANSTSTSQSLYFFANPNGTAEMTLTGSNFGIGTTVPNYKLDVSGSIRATGTIVAQTLVVQTITSSIDYITGSSINGSSISNTHQFTGSVLVSGSMNVNANSLVVNTNGTVSIGNTNSTYNLDVTGTGRFSGALSGTSATFSSSVTASSFVKSGGTAAQFLKADGSVDSTSYQNALTNPVTGTGTTNYLPKFTGTSTIGNSSIQDLTTGVLVNNSVTASGAIARGTNLTPTLIAAANNDVLVGLDINPTFTNGAFTNVVNYAARISGILAGVTQYMSTGASANYHYLELVSTTATNGYVNFRRINGPNGTYAYQLNNGSAYFSVNNLTGETSLFAASGGFFLNFYSGGTEAMRIFGSTKNIVIQNGGTFTDAGFRLDVNGTARVQSTFGVSVLPAVSGTPTATPSTTGGTLADGIYFYRIVAVDFNGNTTTGSNEVSATITGGGGLGSVALSWTAVNNAASYRIYRGTISNTQTLYYTTFNTTYTDTGAVSTAGTVPTVNTTVSTFFNPTSSNGSYIQSNSTSRNSNVLRIRNATGLIAGADASGFFYTGSDQAYHIRYTERSIDTYNYQNNNAQPLRLQSLSINNLELVNGGGSVIIGASNITTTARLYVAGTSTASSALAQGAYFVNTLVAAANNDVLVGLDINPTFTNGAFTGVSNYALRVQGTTNTNFFSSGGVGINQSTDAGFRLDVNGTGRFTGALSGTSATFSSSVTASSFVKSGGTAAQFLKADGSVDSTSYQTSLTFSSPLVNTTGTISIPAATTSVNGYLSSADWTTFNNKQNALTNPVTGTGTTNYLPKFTGTSTIGNSILQDDGTNVSIGYTTNPSLYKLDVNGTLRATGAATFSSSVTAGGYGKFGLQGTSSDVIYRTLYIGGRANNDYVAGIKMDPSKSSNDLGFDTYVYDNGTSGTQYYSINDNRSGAVRFYINGSGNVGIGTTSPSYTLDVTGTLRATGAATFSSSVTAGGYLDILGGSLSSTNGLHQWFNTSTNQAWIQAFQTGVDWRQINYNGSVHNFLINDVTTLYVSNSRNVGIGTTNPSFKLDVQGASNSDVTLRVKSNGTAAPYIRADLSLASYGGFAWDYNGANYWYAGAVNGDVTIALAYYFQGANKMQLTGGGNLLIGTTTDSGYKLDVNGTIRSTAFYESSDSRLKTIIEDNYQAKGIENVVAKLYNKNGKVELGYFAQDLEGILDSAVSKGSDGYLNLSYREVHTAKIAALEQEIKELKTLLNEK
jgi:hypothetical protein